MNDEYGAEAATLDAEILRAIARRQVEDFDDLALRIFAHQARYNQPYARYCASLNVTLDNMPDTWEEIPPVPAGAFKEAALCTFDASRAGLIFKTSGTTTGSGGIHYMEGARLYDASLIAGFDYGVLRGTSDPLRYCMLLASPAQSPHSSLSYMMSRAATRFGDGAESWYVDGDELEAKRLIEDIREIGKSGVPVCIAGTAFAFVNLLDQLGERPATTALPLPSGSRIMETGGFKGRARAVERGELYAKLMDLFGLPEHHIVGEYGMTELSSQYYDSDFEQPYRVKSAPPWLRSYAVDENGKKLPPGVVGALVHVDLANRSSCVAIQTEDLGAVLQDGGIILIGRERGAELRGCSLDAEALRAGVS